MTIALDSALSGLRAAQQQLDIASNNVANASTQGYTRKVLPSQTLIIGGHGHGVIMSAVQRSVDNVLIKDMQAQNSLSQGAGVTRTYLDRIQEFNGSSDSNSSLAAMISGLSQSFTSLSSTPDDNLTLQKTLTAAKQLATKFNTFSSLLTQMRNQAENQIAADISLVNDQLVAIADLNNRIEQLTAGGQSSADLEDQRDEAIQIVSKYMQISTFPANKNTIIVMTKQGQKLADGQASTISFSPSNIVPTSYYPGGAINGIMLDSFDLTQFEMGGEIGALVALRDQILPTYNAQIDELAQKLAERMHLQGLDLFTDLSGNIPASVASPGTPTYVGFAGLMKVNALVQADPTLIRSGTSGNVVLPGSNEIIRKIALFAFGVNVSQRAQGTADLSTAATIFGSTGMLPVNSLIGDMNIAAYSPFLTSNAAIPAGGQFNLTIGGTTNLITIGATDTAADLATNINTAFGSTYATINGLGQLSLNTNANITLANVSIGAAGMSALGFSFGLTAATNPSFTVQVGTQAAVAITVTAASTPATLLASLNAISGLTATINGSNQLVLTPTEGGDILLTDGPGKPLLALGMTVTNVPHAPLRQTNLGPDGTLETGLLANATLETYARSIITGMSEDDQRAQSTHDAAESYLQVLDKRAKDTSGVNIDQEMADMIRIQANYTAAAKMVAAAEKMLDELMNAI